MKTLPFVLLCLAALAQPAHARRTLEVKAVNPSALALNKNGTATVTLVVHAQGTDSCVAIVSAGEGERPRSLQFGPGKPDTQELRLTFRKVGRYVIDIGPRAGQTDCTKTQAVVSVHPEGSDKAAPPRSAAAKAAAACPDGWSMATNDGTRFTCRLIPPRPLACPAGTTYFSQGTQIGCR